MVVKHVGQGKDRERDGRGENEREQKATRAAQGEGSARRASLLVYDSGLQGAFRFLTLAHFECDGQGET